MGLNDHAQETVMIGTAPRIRSLPSRLGGAMALLAGAVLLAACNAQTGAGPTNAPAATTGPTTAAPAAGLTVEVRQHATLGSYVAGKGGMSLYIFKNDSGGTSACTGSCATNWPPLTVSSPADVTAGAGVQGAIGTMHRADGTIQVTLAGKPLYYFSGDAAAGDANGQGFKDLWHLASPSGDPVGGAQATSLGAATPTPTKCVSYCY
jgi:predicted lipoprotein with Yx(FWY)xxD motif